MTWFPVSDDFYSDPQFLGATDAAVALYARAGSWSARYLTDGRVPSTALPTLTSAIEQAPEELCERGVWKRIRGGFQFTDWPRLASRAYIEAKREADRRRQSNNRRSDSKVSRRDTPATRSGVARESRRSRAEPVPVVPTEPSVPTELPFEEAKASSPPTSGDPPKITAQQVVAAWVDAMRANNVQPTSSLKGQVARTARELLESGNDATRVMTAATQAGLKGFATIDRELAAMAGRRPRLAAVVNGPADCGPTWQE